MYVVGFAETVVELLKVNVNISYILLNWDLLYIHICFNGDTFQLWLRDNFSRKDAGLSSHAM